MDGGIVGLCVSHRNFQANTVHIYLSCIHVSGVESACSWVVLGVVRVGRGGGRGLKGCGVGVHSWP